MFRAMEIGLIETVLVESEWEVWLLVVLKKEQ